MSSKDRIRDVTRTLGERYRMNQDAEQTAKTIAEEKAEEGDTYRDRRLKAEAGHILFLDLVGYSRCSNEEQERNARELRSLVRSTPEFQRAEEFGELIRVDTGDGMGLIFFRDPLAPVQCAIEIARAVKGNSRLQLRMGVHTGPITRMPDINGNENVSGAGINLAQRVMDCGDAGHILLSAIAAEMVQSFEMWGSYLTDLGVMTVKHGARIHVFNLVTGDVGNPNLPEKVRVARECATPSTPPLTAPPTTAPKAAIIEFDPDLIARIEGEMRWHIGPTARMVVRDAVRASRGYADLYERLAMEIPDEPGRRTFRNKFEELASITLPKDRPLPEDRPLPDFIAEPEVVPIDKETIATAGKLLAHYIGPLAKLLTARAAQKAINHSEFYQLLAEHLPNSATRLEFLRIMQGDL